MKLGPRVREVKPEQGYRLLLTFTNGEKRVYDVSPLLGEGVFRELKDKSAFCSVQPWHGTVQWAGGQDICPDTLYEDSLPVSGAAISALCESRADNGVEDVAKHSKNKKTARTEGNYTEERRKILKHFRLEDLKPAPRSGHLVVAESPATYSVSRGRTKKVKSGKHGEL